MSVEEPADNWNEDAKARLNEARDRGMKSSDEQIALLADTFGVSKSNIIVNEDDGERTSEELQRDLQGVDIEVNTPRNRMPVSVKTRDSYYLRNGMRGMPLRIDSGEHGRGTSVDYRELMAYEDGDDVEGYLLVWFQSPEPENPECPPDGYILVDKQSLYKNYHAGEIEHEVFENEGGEFLIFKTESVLQASFKCCRVGFSRLRFANDFSELADVDPLKLMTTRWLNEDQ